MSYRRKMEVRFKTSLNTPLSPGGGHTAAGFGFGRYCGMIFAIVAGILLPAASPGQTAGFLAAERPAERSVSGQFIIHSARVMDGSSSLSRMATNRNYIYLRPALLPVSSERIKHLVWRELVTAAPWVGKIHISLYTAASARDVVTIVSERFRDGWQYRMEMPDLLDRTKYVRAMVQVILLEYANRTAGERSAEIPTWLSEGLTQEILTASEMAVILPAPQVNANGLGMAETYRQARRENPLEAAHRVLGTLEPLSYEELSWPRPEHLDGEKAELYQANAHLFVSRLQQLPGGRAGVRAMLEMLPHNHNWQFAFLRAFSDRFQRPLEVEKWWTLQLVHFTGRELTQAMSAGESWAKLNELLRSPVQVRTGTNDLPVRSEVPLQTIVREWDRGLQYPTLERKVQELQAFQLRASPEAALLAEDYRQLLAAYLPERAKLAGANPQKLPKPRRDPDETARALNLLDQRRANFSTAATPAKISQN